MHLLPQSVWRPSRPQSPGDTHMEFVEPAGESQTEWRGWSIWLTKRTTVWLWKQAWPEGSSQSPLQGLELGTFPATFTKTIQHYTVEDLATHSDAQTIITPPDSSTNALNNTVDETGWLSNSFWVRINEQLTPRLAGIAGQGMKCITLSKVDLI